MSPNELRQAYLDFFKGVGHVIVPSAAIVPENDPTTLFTGSGMQPMVPYLLGEKHPLGRRIADSQRCFRSEDIEEVGDNRHTTFFEMLGNWSLGDYFKAEQLRWFFTFLTQTVGLEPQRLYVTVFAGSPEIGIPRDEESVEVWQSLFAEVGIEALTVDKTVQKGLPEGGRIFFYPDTKNWWSRAGAPAKMPIGEPGGPDSEVFFDFGAHLKLHEQSRFAGQPCHVNCDCGRFLEIGNSVFMEYQKTEAGFVKLPQQNVDFGGGFERILAAVQDDPDIFKTELFQPLIRHLERMSGQAYQDSEMVQRSFRVIADHVRAAVMLAVDGVEPGNKEQGYFARRLLRRSMRFARMVGIDKSFLGELTPVVADLYAEPYPQIKENQATIQAILESEEHKFARTLDRGLKEFDKLLQDQGETNRLGGQISPEAAFYLYETYGFPLELTLEMAREKQVKLGESGAEADFVIAFERSKQRHAEASRTASAGKFKGGLQDQSEQTTKLHTATHLLHQALRQVLGPHVQQAGSNITAERLRFDFTHPEKLTKDQLAHIEQIVNEEIQADLPVTIETTSLDEALKSGALAFFGERYGEKVKVYSIGDFSKEVCGGPHVEHTGVLGRFQVGKEEAIGSGKRRVYGYLRTS